MPMNPQQMGSQMQAQPVLQSVPQIISTKDCMYLKDQLSWLLLAMKKCAHYEGECTDPSAKQLARSIGQMHQRHYNLLLKHLQTNNDQILQTLPQTPTQ
jgi:hypothetical protein